MNASLEGDRGALKVLVAEDRPSEREYFAALLRQCGCEVVLASDGQQAVSLFESRRPDCVLLDAHMPGVDGFAACARIKAHAGDSFVPVLLVTADRTAETFTRFTLVGGDECLYKPLSPEVLQAKVRAWRQIAELRERLRREHDELLEHRAQARGEQELAKTLMQRIVRRERGGASNLRVLETPAEAFHGDIVLAAWSPSGRQHLLVGDFTGHGLQAALGALPASDVFYSMTSAGFGVADIVRELNRRLHALLPPNIFLCACALEIDHDSGSIAAWNGGLPPPYVRSARGELQTIASRHLPLGVLAPRDFDNQLQTLAVQRDERVYVYSDGLVEQVNAQGEMFEDRRLRAILAGRGGSELIFERLEMALDAHRRDQPQHDDVTLVELVIDPGAAPSLSRLATCSGAGRRPLSWSLELRLDGAALRELDPRPLLIRALQDLQGLDQHREALHMILSELYLNALDHGVLGCDSALKHEGGGFERYYAERSARLERLEHGSVWVRLEHQPLAEGGLLKICVRDDGAGFDLAKLAPAAPLGPSGRGLALVRSYCESFEHSDGGRACCAVYRWGAAAEEARAA